MAAEAIDSGRAADVLEHSCVRRLDERREPDGE